MSSEAERVGEDGWIVADGRCPVAGEQFIDRVQYRSGDIATAECRAWCLDWKHDPWFPMCDIVACKPEALTAALEEKPDA